MPRFQLCSVHWRGDIEQICVACVKQLLTWMLSRFFHVGIGFSISQTKLVSLWNQLGERKWWKHFEVAILDWHGLTICWDIGTNQNSYRSHFNVPLSLFLLFLFSFLLTSLVGQKICNIYLLCSHTRDLCALFDKNGTDYQGLALEHAAWKVLLSSTIIGEQPWLQCTCQSAFNSPVYFLCAAHPGFPFF